MAETFPDIVIRFPLRRIFTVNVVQQLRADLVLERFPLAPRVQHVWEMQWNQLSAADRETLDDFFQAVRGRSTQVDFTDPWDGVNYPQCRLDLDVLQAAESEPGRWGGSFRLIETGQFKTLPAPTGAMPVLESGAVVTLPYTMQRGYRTEIIIQPDFSEKRWEDWEQSIQRWTVGGENLSDDEVDLLLAAWQGNLGPYHAMAFDEPETAVHYNAVHFIEPQIVHEATAYNSNTLRMTLEQLI